MHFTLTVVGPTGEDEISNLMDPYYEGNDWDPNDEYLGTWDWWVIGGRWDGFYALHNGERANSAQKGDINWHGARTEATEQALRDFGKWEEFLRYNPKPPMPDNTDGWREREDVKAMFEAFKSDDYGFLFNPLREFDGVSKVDYVRTKYMGAFETYAWLDEAEGWVTLEDDWLGNAWQRLQQVKNFYNRIEALPPSTTITVVDFHS